MVLALAAWTLSRLVCPIPEENAGEPLSAQESHPSSVRSALSDHFGTEVPTVTSDRHHTDDCCQVLGASKAISEPLLAHSAFKSNDSSLPALAFATLEVPAPPSRFIKLSPYSNGPPSERYRRFATFWPHAPPADRI